MTSPPNRSRQQAVESQGWDPIGDVLARLHEQGYALAQGADQDYDAVYLPALNQVWIKKYSLSAHNIPLLAHEYFHADACFMQPAMLHPLRNYLLDAEDRPTVREFEDIVESLVSIVLPVLNGRRPTVGSITATRNDYRVWAEQYLALAKDLARQAHRSVRRPTAQALFTLNFLMMHIRPFTTGTTGYLLQLLRRQHLVRSWANNWDLFFELHRRLGNTCQHSLRAQSRFLLAPPVDPHRFFGDMLIFLSGALLAGLEHPNRLLHTVPTLLGILSMGSLFISPTLTLTSTNTKYRVRIGVVHSTHRSNRLIHKIIEVQSQMNKRAHAMGQDCLVLPLFLRVLDMVTPFRNSNSSRRVPDCLHTLLSYLPACLRPILRKQPLCPGCKTVLRDLSVLGAAQHVAIMPPEQRIAFLDAADRYEDWLLTECVQAFIPDRPFHVHKSYRYL